jgi:hypothetical protein
VTITNSTLSGNSTSGGSGGGIFTPSGSLTITNSTLSGNSASNFGNGGGIRNNGASLTLTNSTLSGNNAGNDGGGIYNAGGSTTLTNGTVSNNGASEAGGGIRNAGGTTTPTNSIVADNTGSPNCNGTVTDGGFNLENGTSCGFSNHNVNAEPQLSALANNGGPTQTQALSSDSPALNVIPKASCPPADQRAVPRPQPGTATGCDIGAYELLPVVVDDAYTATGNTPLSVPAPGVLGNDTDTVAPPMSAAVATQPGHGAVSLNPDGSFTYTPTTNFAGTDTFTYTASDTAGFVSGPATVTITVLPDRAYHPLTPARITDTRAGSGLPNAGKTLGPNTTLNVQVTGAGGVPAGAKAAVLNVTATNPTAQSFLTVWPTGASRPTASNLNFKTGQSVPNLVEVGLGTGGQVSVFNPTGSVDVVVDVEGYVGPTATAGTGLYNPLTPARISDTRPDSGFPNSGKTLGPNTTLNVQVTGAGGVPSSGVSAVVLNVTATNPTQQSFLTVWPTGATRPTASNLNFSPGQTVPNRVQVPVGTGGQVSIFNPAGSVDVVVDVGGYFTDSSNPSATGAQFTPTTPARITDTRPGSGLPNAGNTLGPNGSIKVQVSGAGGVPATGVTAAVMNTTVTNTTGQSFLTVWPTAVPQPLVSDLNWVAGQTVPNLVVVKLGSDGAVQVLNAAGSTDVVVDVMGWYS